ncbi:MAG: hypothetical protein SYR96_07830 [Actinomycetota bacterium]|nr:hypothetical protein [Actinomycetota bacterium]
MRGGSCPAASAPIDRIGRGLAVTLELLGRSPSRRPAPVCAPVCSTWPVAVTLSARRAARRSAIAIAVGAGLLTSVIPYAVDLLILSCVPARFFGLSMSIHPVPAVVTGLVLLGRVLNTLRAGRLSR